jgi:large subunit ribosomal protein L4
MELKVYNSQGQVVGSHEASDLVWAHPMHMAVLHQVVLAQQANQRQGTHDTKTRGQVIGSGRKLRAQKHTGRARIGDVTAPRMRGGGIAHGPHPRSYRQDLPKRLRRTALRVALSEKVRRRRLFVLEDFKLDSPSTAGVRSVVDCLKLKGYTLFVTDGVQPVLATSARNLKELGVTPARQLNARDTHRAANVVITRDAVKTVDQIWSSPLVRPPRTARGAAARTVAGAVAAAVAPATGTEAAR